MNKHSIKFKITLLIGGMICVLIVLLLVFNIIFSEKFYMEDKQQEMLNAYSSVNDACIQYSDDSISETDLRNNLEQISTSKGISMIIVNSDWTTFYVSTHGDEMLLESLSLCTTSLFAFATAAIILLISNVTSDPLRLIIFIISKPSLFT